jgi:high affinity Mn2+ porin
MPALTADEVASAPPSDWTLHAQSTYILQMNPAFNSPYQGMNSFDPNEESRHTVSLTLFVGHTLWPGASLYYDPEFTQGSRASATRPESRTSRTARDRGLPLSIPQYATSRLLIRDVVNLGGADSKVDDDQNQVADHGD